MKILVVGQNPSLKTNDNATLRRLAQWMSDAGITHWSFVNIQQAPGKFEPKVEDRHFIWKILMNSPQPIVTLGTHADTMLTKMMIGHHKLPHPSPLNRQLNDPRTHELAVGRLREISAIYNQETT